MRRLAPTPGPWQRVGREIFAADGEVEIGSTYVLQTAYSSVDDETSLANAQLASAAPELLEALKEMVAAFNDPTNDGGFRVFAAETQALDAIAKAEGSDVA